MIKSFRCKDTERVFRGQAAKRFPQNLLKRAKMRLDRIDAAFVLDDLRVPPSHHLEVLQGDRLGQLSIRINDQWRICFAWSDGSAHAVEIVDYH
ncbi:MAG: type II toxin-antitoxin system RelE/ParE family toxin [Magnetococcales bacterium]|nr:type II toxin-antitoxin system RelE/ParE family toxin [Magnetococcales bacterium]